VADRKSITPLTIRLRDPLHGRLIRAAKTHDISLNEEIARRLEMSFEYEDWQKERAQERAERQTGLESLLDFARMAMSIPPKAKESALTALEKYAKASEEEKKAIEKANEKEWSKRLLGEAPHTEQPIPESAKDKPRPSRRE
jgi:hypothetical protein